MGSPELLPWHRALIRARSLVGQGRYVVGAGGRDAAAPSPDSVIRGRRGCDYAGFLAWCLGYNRHQRGFTCGSDWVNADTMICEAETTGAWFRPLATPEIGAIVAFCSIELDRDGHTDRAGHAALIAELPERWHPGDAAWAAMRLIHCSRSIQRRRGHAIDETHAATWAHRATFHGVSHPHWRARFLRYLRADTE
jgi:hypothetical protein